MRVTPGRVEQRGDRLIGLTNSTSPQLHFVRQIIQTIKLFKFIQVFRLVWRNDGKQICICFCFQKNAHAVTSLGHLSTHKNSTSIISFCSLAELLFLITGHVQYIFSQNCTGLGVNISFNGLVIDVELQCA